MEYDQESSYPDTRTYTLVPRLFTSTVGGKQYVTLADIKLPKECQYRNFTVDIALNLAITH
jgi:hypothetical protein